MKKTIMMAGFILANALSIASARANSVEVMSGQKSSTLDLKVSGKLVEKTELFIRSRTTTDYDNRTGHFLLADISYNLVSGLDAVVETQAAAKVVPRAGVQYSHKIGELNLYGMINGTTMDGANAELTLQQSYAPVLSPRIGFFFGLEEVTNVGKEHKYSLQRARVGVSIDDWQLGAAADAIEIGVNPTLDYNVGGFVKKNF